MGKRKAMEPKEEEEKQEEVEEGSEGEDESSDDGSDYSDDSKSSGGSDSAPEVSDEEKEDSPDEDAFDHINVDFQFFDPKESDFHGLKALLHTYLDGQQYDSSPLVDTIIAQSSVGTVVRTGEDEDPIGVMTVLNTQQHKQQPFMDQIKQYMLSKCKDAAVRERISKTWDGAGCGLLINERLINCPPQLSPPLVQALFEEVSWATEDEPTQERRDFFKLSHYVLMTRVYSDPQPGGQAEAAGAQQQQGKAGPSAGKPPAGPKKHQQQQNKKQKGEQQQAAAAGGPLVVYVRPEDEFFHQQAAASYTFPIEGRAVAKDELQPLRLVMLLPASKVTAARSALDAVVGNMASQQQ